MLNLLLVLFCFCLNNYLKHTEGLLSGLCIGSRLVCNNVEPDGLTEGTALSDGDNISFLGGKGRRAVSSNVLMTLFETTVLDNVVKVIPADNKGVLHLGGDDNALEDTSTDGNISGEGALLVDVIALNGGGGSADAKTDVTGETHGLLASVADGTLASDKDSILALVGLFVLIALDVFLSCTGSHLGRFFCC